jgi:hypothetical protein
MIPLNKMLVDKLKGTDFSYSTKNQFQKYRFSEKIWQSLGFGGIVRMPAE